MSQNIFQYQIEGINHDQKPDLKEELEVIIPYVGQLRIVSISQDEVVAKSSENKTISISK